MTARGENNPASRLTQDQVIRAKRIWHDPQTSPTVQHIADFLGVSRRTAHNILVGETWGHVSADDPLTHERREVPA